MATTLGEGFRLYQALKPDVLITDLSVRSDALDGVSFIRRLRTHDEQTPVLVFSMHQDVTVAFRAIEAGASGYLLKDAQPEEFLEAFQTVRQGGSYISRAVASEIALAEVDAMADPTRTSTNRELHVLSRIAEGNSYSVIADELHVSYKAVAHTVSAIKAKLNARSLADLMRICIVNLPYESERRGAWALCSDAGLQCGLEA
ncbi:response regulator transcription factor [Hyphomicrobium sp.]|uniref:response regulator transcription factor n=1 Tax=Hyphomicrobium sp. TaxID=82 RepID=UPI002FE0EB13